MAIYFGALHARDIPIDLLFYNTKGIRIIVKAKYTDHTPPIFKKYNILKLPDIRNIQLGKLMHSITVATLPQPMFTIFTTNDYVHSYATRQKNYSHLPLTKYDYIMRSFVNRGPKL